MPFNGSFGGWLKQRRKALDLTQLDLADQVGCSVMTIRKIEGELRRPSKQIAERLADVLAISEEERPIFVTFARGMELQPPVQSTVEPPLHNLTSQPNPFIGRKDELSLIDGRLKNPACRLLTLVGPGGIGKTRLALQAAGEQVGSFDDGVYFVSLASVSSPELIASSIASALKLSLSGMEDPNTQIINLLRDRDILLVLDNFEHLLNGTVLLTHILENASRLKVLVTSRERLSLQEEWVLQIEGLAFPVQPTHAEASAYSAIQLFAQRAQQVQATFSLSENLEAVMMICRQVEGMPLGIELAASWLRVMPCARIAEQTANTLDFLVTPLRNVPERHRNMRAVFDQSWRLLTEDERTALMSCSVFRGGFDLEAAEQVASADLALLTGLIDKSLVRVAASGRYDMHELVRQYTADKLADAGDCAATERRHFDYFLRLSTQGLDRYYNADEEDWLARLETEHDNFRAALSWSLRSGEAELGLKLAGGLGWFWRRRFYRSEGRLWLEKLLAASSQIPSTARAKALYFAGLLISDLGDNFQAKALAEQAVTVARSVEDEAAIAWSLSILGHITRYVDGGQQSAVPLEEALTLFREMRNTAGMNFALSFLGRAMIHQHQHDQAALLLEEALDLARQAGAQIRIAHALCLLGNIVCHQSAQPERAAGLYQESIALFRASREIYGIDEALLGLASVARAQGDFEQARRLYEECLNSIINSEGGYKYSVAEALWGLGAVARADGDDEQAQSRYREALVVNKGLDKWDTAYCLAGLGGLAADQTKPQRAARLLAAAAVLFESRRDQYAADRIIFDRDVEAARAGLSEVAFAAAWAEGQALSLDEAVAYALQS